MMNETVKPHLTPLKQQSAPLRNQIIASLRKAIELMRERRGLERLEDLCSGPGKLTQALAIGLDLNGSDLIRGPIVIASRPRAWRDVPISVDRRIGITKAAELPWRFTATGSRFVSRRVKVPVA